MSKSVNPNSVVYAFEPVNRVFKKLIENNKLNGYDISCHEIALSNFTGEATIYDQPTDHIYSVTVNQNLAESKENTIPVKIKTKTLVDFVKEQNIESIDLIKLDVETHEPEVLEGLGSLLRQYSPTLLIEILTDEVGYKVERILDGMGYLYFNINEEEGIVQSEKIVKSDSFNYLICKKEVAGKLNLI
jgi:FkbM family methyltransferase